MMFEDNGNKCGKCQNHEYEVLKKGHARDCPFKKCDCLKCRLLDARSDILQVISGKETKLKGTKKDPNCGFCQNHGVKILRKGHVRSCGFGQERHFRLDNCFDCEVHYIRNEVNRLQIKMRRAMKEDRTLSEEQRKTAREAITRDEVEKVCDMARTARKKRESALAAQQVGGLVSSSFGSASAGGCGVGGVGGGANNNNGHSAPRTIGECSTTTITAARAAAAAAATPNASLARIGQREMAAANSRHSTLSGSAASSAATNSLICGGATVAGWQPQLAHQQRIAPIAIKSEPHETQLGGHNSARHNFAPGGHGRLIHHFGQSALVAMTSREASSCAADLLADDDDELLDVEQAQQQQHQQHVCDLVVHNRISGGGVSLNPNNASQGDIWRPWSQQQQQQQAQFPLTQYGSPVMEPNHFSLLNIGTLNQLNNNGPGSQHTGFNSSISPPQPHHAILQGGNLEPNLAPQPSQPMTPSQPASPEQQQLLYTIFRFIFDNLHQQQQQAAQQAAERQ